MSNELNPPIPKGHYPKTLETFERQVNHAVQRRLGCGIYDLPDYLTLSDYWSNDCAKSDDEFWNMVEAATEDLVLENGFELNPY